MPKQPSATYDVQAAAREIDVLLSSAVERNLGTRTGCFVGVSIQDIADIIAKHAVASDGGKHARFTAFQMEQAFNSGANAGYMSSSEGELRRYREKFMATLK